jgi:hypothetical protein
VSSNRRSRRPGVHDSERDRAEDAIAGEARTGDDAGAHLVDPVEHVLFGGEPAVVHPVLPERLRRAASALVKGGDEPLPGPDLVVLLLVHAHCSSLSLTTVALRCVHLVTRMGRHQTWRST